MSGHDVLQDIEVEATGPIDTGENRSIREIGRELEKIGADVGRTIEEKRATEANEDFAEVVAEADERAKRATVRLPFAADTEQPQDILRNLMARQRFAIEQGATSVSDVIALELKTVLLRLKKANPRLADRLEQEFGQFVRHDPGFSALTALDAERTQEARTAKARYDEIITIATDTYKIDLGLYPPNTDRFANLYLWRASLVRAKVDAEFYGEAVQGVANRNAIDKAAQWNKDLIGASALVIEEIDEVRQLAAERVKFILTGASKDLRVGASWDQFEKQNAIDKVLATKFQLQSTFDEKVTFFDRESTVFKTVQTQLDRKVEHLDVLIKALQDDSTTALSMWEAGELVRSAHLREQAPRLASWDNMLKEFGAIMDPQRMASFGKEHKAVQDAIGTQAQAGVSEWTANAYVDGGQDVNTKGMSPLDFRNALRQNLNMNPGPYGFPVNNNDWEGQATAATSHLASQFDLLNEIPPNASPTFVQKFLNSITTNIDHFRNIPDEFIQTDETFHLGLASEGYQKAVEIARTSEDNHVALGAGGDANQDRYVKTHNERMQGIQDITLNQALPGGASAFQLIKLTDAGVTKDGQLQYEIDEKALRTYFANVSTQELAQLGTVPSAALLRDPVLAQQSVRNILQPLVVELQTRANENMRIQGVIYSMQNPSTPMNQEVWDFLFSQNDYGRLAQFNIAPSNE